MVSLFGPCQLSNPPGPPARPVAAPGSVRRLLRPGNGSRPEFVGKSPFQRCARIGNRYHRESLHRGLRGAARPARRPSLARRGGSQEGGTARKRKRRGANRAGGWGGAGLYGLSSFRRAPLMSFVVFMVGSDPILGEGFLRGTDVELPGADHVAHEPLQPILSLSVPFRFDATARLRP